MTGFRRSWIPLCLIYTVLFAVYASATVALLLVQQPQASLIYMIPTPLLMPVTYLLAFRFGPARLPPTAVVKSTGSMLGNFWVATTTGEVAWLSRSQRQPWVDDAPRPSVETHVDGIRMTPPPEGPRWLLQGSFWAANTLIHLAIVYGMSTILMVSDLSGAPLERLGISLIGALIISLCFLLWSTPVLFMGAISIGLWNLWIRSRSPGSITIRGTVLSCAAGRFRLTQEPFETHLRHRAHGVDLHLNSATQRLVIPGQWRELHWLQQHLETNYRPDGDTSNIPDDLRRLNRQRA